MILNQDKFKRCKSATFKLRSFLQNFYRYHFFIIIIKLTNICVTNNQDEYSVLLRPAICFLQAVGVLDLLNMNKKIESDRSL